MPRKKIVPEDAMGEKLKYIGLDLEKIPMALQKTESLDFRIPKFYDEKQYRQYRYVPIKDIQILLSPTNRMDELEEKYKTASPLIEYLDNKNEENILKHTTFLNMLKQVDIADIEKAEKEQNTLNKEIPFKVKFEGNYLWQIYYSENTDKYFMLVPTEDTDCSAFFYLLKKKLSKRVTGQVFVPIRNVSYSTNYLKKSEYEDIENYLWLFTKDWPFIYDVYDKEGNLSIQIVGETQVYGKIKSSYKIVLDSKGKAMQFYKLLKAMFILQTELPHYFEFKTDITTNGEIAFYHEGNLIQYETLPTWINEQYRLGRIKNRDFIKLIRENRGKLQKLKQQAAEQEIEYLAKEKQISTFLECKKTFFGRFKYYFKYNKKKSKKAIRDDEETLENEDNIQVETKIEKKKVPTKRKKRKDNYTIEELMEVYQACEARENQLKDLMMDINALKLKNKNMKKKIENATLFIEEIDSHKKSIFEFWKYSNKDEVAVLAEGEQEEVTLIKKVTKVFDYIEDIENFGEVMDKIQRTKLSKEELDGVYITSTDMLDILNKIKNNEVMPREIEANLREIKRRARDEKTLLEDDFDIFGGIAQDSTKISTIANKKHRELPKDRFNILDISKNTKPIGYKMTLEQIVESIKKALEKVVVSEDLPVYKASIDDTLQTNEFNVFNINPENEIQEAMKQDVLSQKALTSKKHDIYLFKLNLKRGTHAISFTNSVFYDNQNKTLPEGQDLSTKILVDISNLDLELKEENVFHCIEFENEKDDFSEIVIKRIHVINYE